MPVLPLLIQPPAHGRISGGFLYNARMAEHGLWEVCDAPAKDLPGLESRLSPARVVLMDSIWLTPEGAAPFLDWQGRERTLGLMLHSFPSMIVAAEGGNEPRNEPSRFELDTLRRLDFVVVPGRHYAEFLHGSDISALIAEPGLDDAWRLEPRRRAGPCRIVSVGAVTPRKGFLDVAEALAQRGTRDYHWTVVGNLETDPDYAARLAALSESLGSVSLVGQLAPSGVRDVVQQSDLLLMPSYDENQPLVLLEAMAASVPALAYAAGATRTMLEHGRQGLIAPIGDKKLLAEYVNCLLDDETKRYGMALECWKRQQSLPNWATAARQASSALGALLGSNPLGSNPLAGTWPA